MSCRLLPASLALAALLTGCAKNRPIAAPAPLPVPAPVQIAAPRPPDGAAANLTIPARLPDGGYVTPNRDVSGGRALWHLRAAFNVAALNCPDATLAPTYNQLLATHRAALATAHRAAAADYGAATFDSAMTRVYNYFAQPPVLARFCAVAGPALRQAATLAPGTLDGFAPATLAAIDRPFVDFYARYDAYRAQLASWQRGDRQLAATATPRLGYDRSVLAGSTIVTGGRTTLAAR